MAKYGTQEWRDNIAAAMRQSKPPWTHVFAPIKLAADTGDRREAIRLLDEYIKSRKQEQEAA